MRKIFLFGWLLVFISCNKEKMFLPQANATIVAEMQNHSPVYLFFRTNAKDTLVETNKKNTIASTNWIFNIDKRLPLRLVIPEVIKLQEKKDNSNHKVEGTYNFYSYSDSKNQKLAFLPFSKTLYTLSKPTNGIVLYFAKNNTLFVDNILVKKESVNQYLTNLSLQKPGKYVLHFDKNSSYESYIQNKVFIATSKILKSNSANEEFIF